MQYAHSVQRTVVDYPDLWHHVLAQIDVSHQGYAAMKNMLKFQTGSSAYVVLKIKTAPWLLYLRGVDFVARQRNVASRDAITVEDWQTLLLGLRVYREIKDIVGDIVDIIRTFQTKQLFELVYDTVIRLRSSYQNCVVLTGILENFAGTHHIETTILGIMNDMYRTLWNPQVLTPSYTRQIRLALSCMCRTHRTSPTVIASLQLLMTLCRNDLPQVRGVLQLDQCDIVLAVLDIQESFVDDDKIVELCERLYDIFLVTWTAPILPVGAEPPRHVVDIILGLLQTYQGSVVRQTIACRQLRSFCKCNSECGPVSMLRVVNVLQRIQDEHATKMVYDDRREWYLWTFVDTVMRNAATYRGCVHLFGVEFLQDALVSMLQTHLRIDCTYDARFHIDCMQYVSKFLRQIMTSSPMHMATFVEHDGISQLVKIVHHHTKHDLADHYKERFDGHIICLDLLLDTLMAQNKTSTRQSLTLICNRTKVQRKFSIGAIESNSHLTTLPVLLIESLKFSDRYDYSRLKRREYNSINAHTIQNTLAVLSRASDEGDVVCKDMLPYMRQFLVFITTFMRAVQRDVDNVASCILKPVVAACDNFIVNVYNAMLFDCERHIYTLWYSAGFEQYIIATPPYRPKTSTFDKTVLKIRERLRVDECRRIRQSMKAK